MTPTEHKLLTLQTALDIHRANPSKPLPQCVDSARMMLNFCQIECTADEPPPAEPAATEPDYRGLLRELLEALASDSSFDSRKCGATAFAKWCAAVAAVRE